ncbi:MAG: DoxX family protein [Candidatus Omnitrophica bacterium]|nr:DoxX family protein [Candidatus Omnitrophota bacterium]
MKDWGILVLRVSLGVMFFAHGLQIALGKMGGPGPEKFSQFIASLGFTPALIWAYVAGYSILIAGVCLVLGIFSRLACVPLGIFILVAMFKVHWSKGFFITNGGYEYNFIILCALIALMFLGDGTLSITKK